MKHRDHLREFYQALVRDFPGLRGSRVAVRGPHGSLEPARAEEVRRGLVRDLAALAVDLAAKGKLP